MADGVNTGGFVPTQPAIVDTSAAFTRLLNVAQRQQERDTAMQLAEQQRRQKQMEAQLDVINGFDSSKMVADDRMMFNDAVNQLRMDFVEGKITDPMQFRGRVAKLRNYYGQFTQYAQNPETLALKGQMMKYAYLPSELNKANEDLGPGQNYVVDPATYNERNYRFEHPLNGAEYQITPQGDIMVGSVPVDAIPRQGAALFEPDREFTGQNNIDGIVKASTDVNRALQRGTPLSNYIPTAYEGNLIGNAEGRAAMVGSYEQAGNSFAGFDDFIEAFIMGGRVGVNELIASIPEGEQPRATAMQSLAEDFYDASYKEWDRAVRNRAGIDTRPGSAQARALARKQASLLGVKDMRPITPFKNENIPIPSFTAGVQGGMDIPWSVDGTEEMVKPIRLTVNSRGNLILTYADQFGGLKQAKVEPDQRPEVSRYLSEEFDVTLGQFVNNYLQRFPATQRATTTTTTTTQTPTAPASGFIAYSGAPGEPGTEQIAAPQEQAQIAPPTTPTPTTTLEPVDTGVEVTAITGSPQRDIQERNVELRTEAIENPESLKLLIREDYNISPFATRTPEDNVFRDNLRSLLDDASFRNALIQSGYVDFRGLIGDVSGDKRNDAMMAALDVMGNDERAQKVKQYIQKNKAKF